jgi:hypothetical protein
MHLSKRDQEYLIPKPLIVIVIMFGAAALVTAAYAIHRTFGFGRDGNGFKHVSVGQMYYMREVRARNMDSMAYEGALSQWAAGRKGKAMGMRQ